MKVILAKTAGFCFGVDRAVSLVEEAVAQGKEACKKVFGTQMRLPAGKAQPGTPAGSVNGWQAAHGSAHGKKAFHQAGLLQQGQGVPGAGLACLLCQAGRIGVGIGKAVRTAQAARCARKPGAFWDKVHFRDCLLW